MADGCHVGKYWNCHNSPTSGLAEMSHPPWCGCHGNSRCPATAHWTL